jgi:hypothetical protein
LPSEERKIASQGKNKRSSKKEYLPFEEQIFASQKFLKR